MVSSSIDIPEKHVGLLIGKGGSTKKLIERTGNVKIEIEECLVTIIGDDGLNVMKATEVVKAIGAGLPFKSAFDLFKEGYQLVVYDLEPVVTNRAALDRQKARIIGEKGKAKKFFEDALGLKIFITESDVIAIGASDRLKIFREALERLVHGASHSGVYRYVETHLKHLRPVKADIRSEIE